MSIPDFVNTVLPLAQEPVLWAGQLPPPTPEPGGGGGGPIDTDAVMKFLATKIAPILLGFLGVIFIARANKGEVSRVLTSSVIAIVGIAFVVSAVALIGFGDDLVDIFLTEE